MSGITPNIEGPQGGRYFVIGRQKVHFTEQDPDILNARVMGTSWEGRVLEPVGSVAVALSCIVKLPGIVDTPEFQSVLKNVIEPMTPGDPLLEVLASWLTTTA